MTIMCMNVPCKIIKMEGKELRPSTYLLKGIGESGEPRNAKAFTISVMHEFPLICLDCIKMIPAILHLFIRNT